MVVVALRRSPLSLISSSLLLDVVVVLRVVDGDGVWLESVGAIGGGGVACF